MNPWITGRIIETMQQEARNRGDEARLGLESRRSHHDHLEPRRTRVGLAVARIGLRIAGRESEPLVARPHYRTSSIEATYRSNPWTTCGATSTSSH